MKASLLCHLNLLRASSKVTMIASIEDVPSFAPLKLGAVYFRFGALPPGHAEGRVPSRSRNDDHAYGSRGVGEGGLLGYLSSRLGV